MQLPFIFGEAKGRSTAESSAEMVNLYAEQGGTGCKSLLYAIGTPGATTFAAVPSEYGVRKLFASARNRLFAVVGNQFVELDRAGTPTVIDTIATLVGDMDMAENTVGQIMIVDGIKGYIYDTTKPGSKLHVLDPNQNTTSGNPTVNQSTYSVTSSPGTTTQTVTNPDGS